MKNSAIIGLCIALKEQRQLLLRCAELLEVMQEDDDDDEIPFYAQHVSRPRSLWTFSRYGTFWEKHIPNNSAEFFKESLRVDRETFPLLVHHLEGLRKKDTKFRNCIPLEKRLAIALYTLGSSAEYRTVGRLFGVSTSSVCNILHDFCEEVIENLAKDFLPADFLTACKIDECVKGFQDLGFPQCLGAIDGCHIEIKPPAAEAVDHYNYKWWYSTVLFALVDYRYRFLYVNVGCPGRCNDSHIYQHSKLSIMIETSQVLKEKSVQICNTEVPIVLIGDSAFKFSQTLMKPYPFSTSATTEQQMFNYNLSKARRVVENAFGHLKARFRRLGKGLDNHPKFNNRIIMCCCILHNFLNCQNSVINENWNIEEPESRLQPDDNNRAADFSQPAENIRAAIAKFFTTR